MCAIGERLKEERERLGFNQEQMGAIGGVNRNSQSKYEKGDRHPDSTYLAAVASAGVDVLYVLTGTRSQTESSLDPSEAALLDNYRKTSPERRASLDEVSRAFASTSSEQDGKQQSGTE